MQKKLPVSSYDADLFLYFYERGLRLLKQEARLSYITSGTFMNSSSGKPFREYINEKASLETVLNFGENQPFRGAEMVYPTIAVMRNGKPNPTFRSLFIDGTRIPDDLNIALDEHGSDCLSSVTGMDEWRFQAAEFTKLFQKLTMGYQTLLQAVNNQVLYGVLTGLNEAFVITDEQRQRLIAEDASSREMIQPMVRGEDCRPWYQINSGLYLITARQGINIDQYPAVKRHLEQFRNRLEPKPNSWNDKRDGKWMGRTSGNYKWFEWHDTVAYYQNFEKPKIFWAEIAKLPRFSWSEDSLYSTNKAHIVVPQSKSILPLLNSRVMWFVISQICVPLRLRAGLWQYQLTHQFVRRLPIPELSADQEKQLAEIAEQITALAKNRYELHEAMRRRIAADLGRGGKLNERLSEWWLLDSAAELRAEVRKSFRTDIPLGERDEWDKYLADQRGKHQAFTQQIVGLETRLNGIVYEAFKLTPDEIGLIEKATKYRYGEV